MLRLVGNTGKEALADRIKVARDFSTRHSVIVVLKGSRSLIAAPDGTVVINPTGNAGLGTAGAGDTLTGVIAGFLSQAYATLNSRADAFATTVAATYLSGLAGDFAASKRGMRTMVASDIAAHLSDAILMLDREGEIPKGSGVDLCNRG
jgi:NAD(P)H-hydrate epimerase